MLVSVSLIRTIAASPPVNGVLVYMTGPNESLMERLQKQAPAAKFVKAFSSVGSALMVNPKLPAKPTMFICGSDAGAKDVARFLFMCRAIFVSAEDSYFQHEQGLLDDMSFGSFESSVKGGMGVAGVAAAWVITAEMYEPQFRDYMNRMLADLKAPSAQSEGGLDRWKRAIAAVSRTDAQ